MMKTIARIASLFSLWCGAGGAADLVRIPPTARVMSDPLTGMQVKVSVDEFLISPTETTQREFQEAMDITPRPTRAGSSRGKRELVGGDPVLQFAQHPRRPGALLQPGHRSMADFSRNGYRLPTDAEWEHANGGPTP